MENYTDFEEIKEIKDELKETETTEPEADFEILETEENKEVENDESETTEDDFEPTEEQEDLHSFGSFMAELNCFVLPPLTSFILNFLNKKPFAVDIGDETKARLCEYYNLIFENSQIDPKTKGYMGIITINASYIFTAFMFAEDKEEKKDEKESVKTNESGEKKKRGRPKKVKI